MHILLAFLCVSAAAAPGCHSLPTKGDSVKNTIHNLMSIAQITLVHIKNLPTKLPEAALIHHSDITPSIEGLTSISHYLGFLDNELQSPSTELLSQIQYDVSSLEGRVRSLAVTMDCPVAARQERTEGSDIDNSFPDSHLYMTLTRVQHYLQQFLLNKDKLKVC